MKLTHEIRLTPAQIAEALWELDDEQQADVFIELGRLTSTEGHLASMQWLAVGRHLARCQCSTDAARDVVDGLHQGMHSAAPAPALDPKIQAFLDQSCTGCGEAECICDELEDGDLEDRLERALDSAGEPMRGRAVP